MVLVKGRRPVSNLSFNSKLTERVVADQIKGHITANKLYPLLQSAYRKNHSTETALLKVKNDLLLAMNKGHVTLLFLLDLSAAFDTVNHDILMRRLGTKLGLMETALSWFSSYLTGCHQKVSVNSTFSDSLCSGPWGPGSASKRASEREGMGRREGEQSLHQDYCLNVMLPIT